MVRPLAILFFAACTPSPPPDAGTTTCDEGLAVGDCAPDFTLPDAQGVPWTLSDHRGDVVVVEISGFW